MSKSRDNHYVPQWYQKGFLFNESDPIHYLDLHPDKRRLNDGRIITLNNQFKYPSSKCFYQTDLYTTFFGGHGNDEIERLLFGQVDDSGARAVRAFAGNDPVGWHKHFFDFFTYIDTQKIRTPKGLDWIKQQYPELDQLSLMREMQSIRNLHCTIWTEGVREIVSAEKSDIKFILTDHPVTIYNYACDPSDDLCFYPSDPAITKKASQTIFPLNKDFCLILTNLEYANQPNTVNPVENRTNAKMVRRSMVKTDSLIRVRGLDNPEVSEINLILKARAKRFIAAAKPEWLFPEKDCSKNWEQLKETLLPPSDELHHFGGEMYVRYKDGSTYHQDAFGRQEPENEYLRKELPEGKIGRNDYCPCGSGKKYKKCCEKLAINERPPWDVLSIRERNIAFYKGIYGILEFKEGKTWDQIKEEFNDEKVKKLHNLYWYLWPLETDIIDLLPRPDTSLRVIYTGLLDPRKIMLPLGASPIFDEIIMQHPFVHPKAVNPEFSPIDNPHQHRAQTLKNVLFMLFLEPFVKAGIVNLIPDPCVFNNLIHREMMDMASLRRGKKRIDSAEEKIMREMAEDDFKRTFNALPEDVLKHKITEQSPELTEDKVKELIAYLKDVQQKDPLAIPDDDLYMDRGQLSMSNMAPNFEMVLFIAQLTGAGVFTDSPTRFEEIAESQRRSGKDESSFSIEKIYSQLQFVFSTEAETTIDMHYEEKYGQFRSTVRDLFNRLKSDNKMHIEHFKGEAIQDSFECIAKDYNLEIPNQFKSRIEMLAPTGGFSHNNVQRLLLKSGVQKTIHLFL